MKDYKILEKFIFKVIINSNTNFVISNTDHYYWVKSWFFLQWTSKVYNRASGIFNILVSWNNFLITLRNCDIYDFGYIVSRYNSVINYYTCFLPFNPISLHLLQVSILYFIA